MKEKNRIDEGLFSKTIGRALLFLSGAGKDYKKLKKNINDPVYKRKMKDLEDSLKTVAQKFDDIDKMYGR